MTSYNSILSERLAILADGLVKRTLPGIKHGVEREALRINPNGSLAQTPHPESLGAALTHEYITTDFSESLLEFITPPESDPEKTVAQLRDIHKYVLNNIGDERLWPMSMPCYVESGDEIPIAQYGSSNIGKMKTLYREGLKNRYGSMMQAISGVHFNFSLPDEFWQVWIDKAEGQPASKDSISAAYFGLIRNYRRFCWMIPYLFGASPALCGSFIKGNESSLPFKKLAGGTYYLPYATSLRMSDLGYTNSAQSGLAICYNKVDTYINSLRKAINTPSDEYVQFASKVGGEYQQLNANVLQIENELYSPIRPKQPTNPLEKPTDALHERGVSYIEVRALDVNPFSDIGIDLEQFYFLDVFLLYCLVAPSEYMDEDQYHQTEENLGTVVTDGRDPALKLHNGDKLQSVKEWGTELFNGMSGIADILDEANGHKHFSAALAKQQKKLDDSDLTPSGAILKQLLENDMDNGSLGIELAQRFKESLAVESYKTLSEVTLTEQAEASLEAQTELEKKDNISFDEFLRDYFSEESIELKKQNLA